MGEDSRFCPNCKKEVASSNFKVHSAHCQRNVVVCQLCLTPVLKSQYQQHLGTQHTTVQCSKCQATVPVAQILVHQHEECVKRLIACQYCELELYSDEAAKHLDYCGSRTERCKGCTKYVQQRYLQFHYAHDHKYLVPEEKARAEECGGGEESSEECPICLGPITLPLALECGHVFCMVCVKGIANTTKNCAICRRDIPRDMLMDIRFCCEEDVIKNYVTKPRGGKKDARSHSAPAFRPMAGGLASTRLATSARTANTAQDYDSMVSHLMSNRAASTPYRYQRPSITQTTYTPYSSSATATTASSSTAMAASTSPAFHSSQRRSSITSSEPSKVCGDADSTCCSPATATATNTTVPSVVRPTPVVNTLGNRGISNSGAASSVILPRTSPVNTTEVSSPSLPLTSVSSATNSLPRTSVSRSSNTQLSQTDSVNSSSGPHEETRRPRRPTSLALTSAYSPDLPNSTTQISSQNESTPTGSQEEYDRWLAFQLAQTEEDLPAAEFNRRHRPVFGRSHSMPERQRIVVSSTADDSISSPSSSSCSDSDDNSHNSSISKPISLHNGDSQNSKVPLKGVKSSSSSVTTALRGSAGCSSQSSPSSANGSPNLSKSSSESSSTGARPKHSVSLKKRVSFKEEAPLIRREAPVLLPCEFCNEMYSERDLMRHQTSCDENETQQPRLTRRASVTPTYTTRTAELASPSRSTSAPSSNLASPASPSNARGILPPLPSPALNRRTTENSTRSPTTVASPMSLAPSMAGRPAATNPKKRVLSGQITDLSVANQNSFTTSTSNRGTHQPSSLSADTRPTSVSPCSLPSVCSSSGVSSMCSSNRSNTPTSSSVSPTPPSFDPAKEADNNNQCEDEAFPKPRRGRLLSSAIFSWRNISGPKENAERPKYMRSNTAPLEDTGDVESNPVTTSQSVCQLPPLPPIRPELHYSNGNSSDAQKNVSVTQQEAVFVKNPNKYRAPLPPQASQNSSNANKADVTPSVLQTTVTRSTDVGQLNAKTCQPNKDIRVFRFDSKTMMSNEPNTEVVVKVSDSVKEPTGVENPQNVQVPTVKVHVSQATVCSSDNRSPLSLRHSKGPAPQPPVMSSATTSHNCIAAFSCSVQVSSINSSCSLSTSSSSASFGGSSVSYSAPSASYSISTTSDYSSFSTRVTFSSVQSTTCASEQTENTLLPLATADPSMRDSTSSTITTTAAAAAAASTATTATTTTVSNDNTSKRLQRAQSVLDERCLANMAARRLDRASSIRETSRPRYTPASPMLARRWSSRDILPSSHAADTAALGSTLSLYSGMAPSYYSSQGWSSHVGFARDDVRSRLTAISTASLYGNGRYRERSATRPGRAFQYGSSTRLTFDQSVPSRTFAVTDSFIPTSSKRRYVR